MSNDEKQSTKSGKVFESFVSCTQIIGTIVGVLALIVAIISLIWVVRNPGAAIQIVQVVSGGQTSTPVIITLPSSTPQPTYTPFPIQPNPTATSKSLPIAGIWKGKTVGHNASGPIAEVLTTVSISDDCQINKDCGFFVTEGRCTYKMTLTDVQDNTFIFDTIAVSGTPSCYGDNPEKTMVIITLESETEISFHYQTLDSSVERDGTLTK